MKIQEKGFTLIEVMVVIAIIAILAAIIFGPKNKKSTSTEQEIKDAANVVVEKVGNVVDKLTSDNQITIGCENGEKIILINGKLFYLGKKEGTWNELKSVKCE